VHLVRPPADRARELLEQLQRPNVSERTAGTEQRHAELGPIAAGLGPHDLHHRAVDVRAAPVANRRTNPGLHVVEDLLERVRVRESLAENRLVFTAEPARELDQIRVAERGSVAATDDRCFVREDRARRGPSVVDLADDVRGRHAHVGEEHLVEVRGPGDLPQRSNLDTGAAQIQKKERDAPMLRRVEIGARQQDREVAEVRVRRPDLLPVHDELVARTLGPRRQIREIAARRRLAEELAPRLLRAQERSYVARLLRRTPVRQEHRPDHPDRRRDEAGTHTESGLFLGEHRCVRRSEPPTAVLNGPGDARPASVEQLALPGAAGVEEIAVVPRSGAPVAHRGRVLLEPRARFGAKHFVGLHRVGIPTHFWTRVKSHVMFHDAATFANGFPHETFRDLRRNDPVSHHDHPLWKRGYWVIARHADVQRVSRDSDTFSNAPNCFLDGAMAEDDPTMAELLISQDPPIHTKLRKLINKGFTPRRVAALEDKVRERVDAIIASVAGTNECDLVTDIALWLPLHVIADLVGVPEEDREQVFRWTELTFGFDEKVTPEERSDAATAMYMYANALGEQRRADPRDDLMSVLITAEVNGESLTQMQIDLFFMLLQNAGSETTRNLLTTGTIVLLEHFDQFERLRRDTSLLPAAIEELLRWVSPVMQFTRRATKDTEIAGQPIAAGERVVLVYPSANRDERAFEDPDRLDITRSPNDHVAFGAGGPHFCLGANLARFEARVMFEALLTRFEGLEVTAPVDSLPRVHSNLIDGFANVPIRWNALQPAGSNP
jgi:cholest-4-en-3-one 26-monooxygenase